MRRKPRIPAKPFIVRGHVLDDRRMTGVRGGDGLGITISVPDPTGAIWNNQHNEALIRL
jgi:hypothetical protein